MYPWVSVCELSHLGHGCPKIAVQWQLDCFIKVLLSFRQDIELQVDPSWSCQHLSES